MRLVSSKYQTRQWRLSQKWYQCGRRNECEKFQRAMFERITGVACPTTPDRIRMSMRRIEPCRNVLALDDAFDWTENFDGKVRTRGGAPVYVNFKFVCGDGGAQTRTLRELYHFIRAQADLIRSLPDVPDTPKPIFINILDGSTCHRYFNKLRNAANAPGIYVGDLYTFAQRWQKSNKRISVDE